MTPTRREFALGALGGGLAGSAHARPAPVRVYVGSNGVGDGAGISRLSFDPMRGTFGDVRLLAATASPANIFLHPNRRILYAATGEGAAVDGQNQVQAFRLAEGAATLLDSLPCGGLTPVQGMVAARQGFMATANYRGDNLCLVPLRPDGRFAAAAPILLPISGDKGLKPHEVIPAPGGRFAIVPLIGGDRCEVYRIVAGGLAPHGTARVPAGAGPRHAAFHPDGRRMFTSDETGAAVSSYAWDGAQGRLEHLATVAASAGGAPGARPSHIAVHPNGRWLYVANRGPGTISTFAMDPAGGGLRRVGESPGGGATAWHFLVLDGWILVGDLTENRISALAIDPTTGVPTLTEATATVRAPTSLALA